jgi:hypothetical protein
LGPQLIPAGLDVTVPLPKPVLLTLSVNCCNVKVAVTDLAALIVTVQVAPETPSHPLQPPKMELPLAVAVSVTIVPLLKDAEHAVPQLMPDGLEVTVPLPLPALLTARVNCGSVNVAVTDLAAFIVTVQVAPETPSHPFQPPKMEVPLAVAVSVTNVPLLKEAEHAVPQLMPDGLEVTVPLPLPAVLTVKVNCCGVNVAVMDFAAPIVTVQVTPETLSHPLQPLNVEFVSACAVSVTTVPLS